MPSKHNDKFSKCTSALIPDLEGLVILSPAVGRLQLIKRIGRGAWGVVYSARSVSNPTKEFAVKCISTATERCNPFLVQREANLQARASAVSANVLCIHDILDDKHLKITFVVTDLCAAGDLLEHILKGSFFRKDELVRGLFVQVVDAVIACHSLGIYHRDLKPENILCKLDGTLVLTDFGLATRSRYSASFKTGSTPFMSPEVLGGLHRRETCYSPAKTDIWALGVILINLICGRAPWRAASVSDPAFSWFLRRHHDFFYKAFAISHDAQYILSRIFMLNPEDRISILELRDLIQKADTFSRDLSEEECTLCDSSFEQIFGSGNPRLTKEISEKAGDWNRGRNMTHGEARETMFRSAPEWEFRAVAEANSPLANIKPRKLEGMIESTMAVASLHFPDEQVVDEGDVAPVLDPGLPHEIVFYLCAKQSSRGASRQSIGSDIRSDSGSESVGPVTPEMPAADRCAPFIVGGTGGDLHPDARAVAFIDDIEDFDLGEPAVVASPIPCKPLLAHKSPSPCAQVCSPPLQPKVRFLPAPPPPIKGRTSLPAACDVNARSRFRVYQNQPVPPPTTRAQAQARARSKVATIAQVYLTLPPPALLPLDRTGCSRGIDALRQAADMLGKPLRPRA